MKQSFPLPLNKAVNDTMLTMLLDIMAKQNLILAQLTEMNKLDPEFIDKQVEIEKQEIIKQLMDIYSME
ncbi:MAG: hypothetical protein JWN76_1572 [Chitinophagaceae bacterium]|nr:hypothetical protein [Chitinophagaceae bacterium]